METKEPNKVDVKYYETDGVLLFVKNTKLIIKPMKPAISEEYEHGRWRLTRLE